MANADAPFGLRPVRYKNGAPWNGAATRYYVSSAGANYFIGDPMDLAGSADSDGVPTVSKATLADGNYTIGPIVAVEPETEASTVYVASGDNRYVWVADDPNLIFEIQADSQGTIAASEIGLNAIMIETHSGSTTTGLSGIELDTTTDAPATDASNMLLIIGGSRRVDNDFDAQHGIIEVMISAHRFLNELGGRLGT